MFYISVLNFAGSKTVFESEDKSLISKKLKELGAYKQPMMMDGGYMLIHEGNSYDIDKFVDKFHK